MHNNKDVYQLLGHECSLYTGKTRAYLRYKKIPFKEEINAKLHQQIKEKVGKKIIPVLVTPEGEYIQDTTVIMERMEQRFPENPVNPSTPKQHLVSLLMELYGNEWLLMPAMHYRWEFKKQNLAFITEQFGDALHPKWPTWAKRISSIPLALFFGQLYKPLLGMSKNIRPEVEKSTEAFLRDFDKHLEQHDFLLGSRPCVGDFGLVAPLYAHLARDPYPKQLMQRIAPNVYRWTQRMQHPDGKVGDFLPNDEIPKTLYPILTRMFNEQLPVLIDTIDKVADWADKHSDKVELPRFVGRHDYTLGSERARRCVIPFQQWLFQRSLNYYQGLSTEDKIDVDELLKQFGGYDSLQTQVKVPLDYVNYKLVRAN